MRCSIIDGGMPVSSIDSGTGGTTSISVGSLVSRESMTALTGGPPAFKLLYRMGHVPAIWVPGILVLCGARYRSELFELKRRPRLRRLDAFFDHAVMDMLRELHRGGATICM